MPPGLIDLTAFVLSLLLFGEGNYIIFFIQIFVKEVVLVIKVLIKLFDVIRNEEIVYGISNGSDSSYCTYDSQYPYQWVGLLFLYLLILPVSCPYVYAPSCTYRTRYFILYHSTYFLCTQDCFFSFAKDASILRVPMVVESKSTVTSVSLPFGFMAVTVSAPNLIWLTRSPTV